MIDKNHIMDKSNEYINNNNPFGIFTLFLYDISLVFVSNPHVTKSKNRKKTHGMVSWNNFPVLLPKS